MARRRAVSVRQMVAIAADQPKRCETGICYALNGDCLACGAYNGEECQQKRATHPTTQTPGDSNG